MEDGLLPGFSDYAHYAGVFLIAAILAFVLAVVLSRICKRRLREETGVMDSVTERIVCGGDPRSHLREDVMRGLLGPDQWELRRTRIESLLLRLGAEPGPYMVPAIECYGKLIHAGRDRMVCMPVLEEIRRRF